MSNFEGDPEVLESPARPGLVHLTYGESRIDLDALNYIPVTCSDLLPREEDDNINSEAIYDFFTFPDEQYGLKFETNGKRTPNKNIKLPDKLDGRWKEEPIVQRWLFFELLREVLGTVKGFKYSHFIVHESDRDLISTQHLPYYLGQWRKNEASDDRTGQTLRLARIQRVLDHARYFVSNYCKVDDAEGNPIWPVNGLIALSIMVVGETLTRAQIIIQKSVDHNVAGWVNHDYRSQGWGFSKAVLVHLQQKGWCMKTIHMLQGLLRKNTIGLMYLFALGIEPPPGHRHCTTTDCVEKRSPKITRRLPAPKYETKHHCNRYKRDSCHTVGLGRDGMEKLAEIIRTGGTPLLRYSKPDQKLEVVQTRDGQKDYAIFSHVWSDGYGNPVSNEINVCVLDAFESLFNNIKNQTGRHERASRVSELFWIDTLTIPVGDKYKAERTKAISQMHNTYRWAKYTIVLDNSLMKLKRGSGYSAPAMKITMSTWMTRLWTLQEAVLSRHLYFNFQDSLYSMDILEDLYETDNAILHSCIPEVAHTYWHGILGAQRQEIHNSTNPEKGAPFLASVWKATQWRTTAHQHHETLALATLLNVDAREFAGNSNTTMPDGDQGDLDRLMRRLLDLLAQTGNYPIPAGMIFLAGPKLSGKGYSWAPRSWLSTQEVDPPDPLEPTLRKKAQFYPGSHFEVEYPGFKLHELSRRNGTASSLWSSKHFFFPVDSTLLEWYNVEKADIHERFPTEAEIAGRTLALIMPRVPVIDPTREIAVLVAINKTQNRGYHANILARVWTSRERDQPTLQRWRDDFQKDLLQTACLGEELPANQKWLLDGRKPEEEQTGSDGQSMRSFIVDAVGASFDTLTTAASSFAYSNPLKRQPSFAKKMLRRIPFPGRRMPSSDGGSLMRMISERTTDTANGANGKVGSVRHH